MKRCTSVAEYITGHPQWQAELELLRGLLLKNKALGEGIKWGAPIYTLNGKNVIGIGAFKSYVGLWFHQGVFLADKANVLINAQSGKTKALRQWRFNSLKEIDSTLVEQYIREAIQNQLAGKEVKPAKNSALVIPPELTEALNASKPLAAQFKKLTPFRQKEYCEYIEIAKRAKTKLARLDKIIPMIREGKGLNDKYR